MGHCDRDCRDSKCFSRGAGLPRGYIEDKVVAACRSYCVVCIASSSSSIEVLGLPHRLVRPIGIIADAGSQLLPQVLQVFAGLPGSMAPGGCAA